MNQVKAYQGGEYGKEQEERWELLTELARIKKQLHLGESLYTNLEEAEVPNPDPNPSPNSNSNPNINHNLNPAGGFPVSRR